MAFFAMAALISLLSDYAVCPHVFSVRNWRGLLINLLLLLIFIGVFLAISGNYIASCIFCMSMVSLVTGISNAKYKILGEPIIFSDFALISSIFKHPQFYMSALSLRMRLLMVLGALVLLTLSAGLFVFNPIPHLVGCVLLLVSAMALRGVLASSAFGRLVPEPDIVRDLGRYGLAATLFLYWKAWRASSDPVARSPRVSNGIETAARPELVVIVQCESFADPVALTGEVEHALEGLGGARSRAFQWGELHVSGFGAYTMRTEYGVLFGRSEKALGFRRFDPFLTAHRETSYALSAQLRDLGYRCLFVHPHDMRFYGRDRLMPAIGFDQLVGEEHFDATASDHRYIKDRVLGASITELIRAASGPTMVYAVTMENHGPWSANRRDDTKGGLAAYLRHLKNSDGMLSDLIGQMADIGRSGLLVFFGDHRPSIPGVNKPGSARHTPYVVMQFSNDGEMIAGANRRIDLSPDELHHIILGLVEGWDGRSNPM